MISIITCTQRPDFLPIILRNFENQHVKEKELILVLHGFIGKLASEIVHNPQINIVHISEDELLGTCMNQAIQLAKYDVIAKFDDDDYYGPLYLTEALNSMREKEVDVVGKQSVFVYFKQEQLLSLLFPGKEDKMIKGPSENLAGATLVFKKFISERIKFPPLSVGEDTFFVEECKKKRVSIFATSPYNYVYIRYTNSHHSSDAGNKRLMKHCLPLTNTSKFEQYVNLDRRG